MNIIFNAMQPYPRSLGMFLLFVMLIQCESPESIKAQSKDNSSDIIAQEGTEIDIESTSSFQYKPGPVILKAEITNGSIHTNTYVKLFETEGRDFFLKDSARIENGICVFQLNDVIPGIYKIGISSEASGMADIILNPNEPKLSMTFGSVNFKPGFTHTDSRENQGLKTYTLLENNHLKDLQRIRAGSSQNKREEIYNAQAGLKKIQNQMATDYQGTYLSNFLIHLQSPSRFSKENYWSDVDFKDISLIKSPVFPNRIEDYMRIHASADKSESNPKAGFYNAVDRIAGIAQEKGKDEVLEFILYVMSEGFYSSGMEDLSLYVIDNYFYGDGCGDADISELFKQKASGIRNLQVGNMPPNFSTKTVDNKIIEFDKIAKAHQYTLLLFWASFCHKCEEIIPDIKTVYNMYNDKGLEVVAVSVDTDKSDWVKGMQKHQTRWSNTCDLEGWRSEVTRAYRVTSTPVMFLVDENRMLVAKPKTASELNSFLKAQLK